MIVKPFSILTCPNGHPCFVAPRGLKGRRANWTTASLIRKNCLVKLDHVCKELKMPWDYYTWTCGKCYGPVFSIHRDIVLAVWVKGKEVSINR